VEPLALAVVLKLRGKNGFDVVWIYGKYTSKTQDTRFSSLVVVVLILEIALPGFEMAVGFTVSDCASNEFQAFYLLVTGSQQHIGGLYRRASRMEFEVHDLQEH